MPESRQIDFFISSGGCLIVCSPSVKASLSTGSLVFVCSHYWQGFHVCRKRLSVKLLTNIGSSGLCILFRFLYLPCLISKKQMHISSCCKISLRRRHRSLHSSPPCPPTHNTNNGDTSKKNTAITGVFISYQCQEQSWRNMRKNTTGSRKDREREREREIGLKDWIQPQVTGGFIGALQDAIGSVWNMCTSRRFFQI